MVRDMRRFKAHYGIGPEAIKALIADLESTGTTVSPKRLFLIPSHLLAQVVRDGGGDGRKVGVGRKKMQGDQK